MPGTGAGSVPPRRPAATRSARCSCRPRRADRGSISRSKKRRLAGVRLLASATAEEEAQGHRDAGSRSRGTAGKARRGGDSGSLARSAGVAAPAALEHPGGRYRRATAVADGGGAAGGAAGRNRVARAHARDADRTAVAPVGRARWRGDAARVVGQGAALRPTTARHRTGAGARSVSSDRAQGRGRGMVVGRRRNPDAADTKRRTSSAGGRARHDRVGGRGAGGRGGVGSRGRAGASDADRGSAPTRARRRHDAGTARHRRHHARCDGRGRGASSLWRPSARRDLRPARIAHDARRSDHLRRLDGG